MRKILLLVLIGCTSFTAFSQFNGTIKGKLLDTITRQDLTDATVSVLSAKDSVPVSFTVADNKGGFQVKDLDTGQYRLLISFQGFRPVSRNFAITKEVSSIDFGTIYMDNKSVLLDAVTVERPPITIKKDTVEFSAG